MSFIQLQKEGMEVFNERIALKMRMEQLNEREHIIIREFQAERDTIYKRLRELDNGKHALPCLRELAKQEKFIMLSLRAN